MRGLRIGLPELSDRKLSIIGDMEHTEMKSLITFLFSVSSVLSAVKLFP